MNKRGDLRVRAWLALAVLCGGGLLPADCMLRTRQAVIDGSKSFLVNVLLNPENLADLPYDELVGNPDPDETDE